MSNINDRLKNATDPMEQYKQLMASLSPSDKVKIAFQQSASNYWGKVGKVIVIPTSETDKGTKYFIVMADIQKEGKNKKLLQEWFIGKDGNAKVTNNRVAIEEEYATDIGMFLDEECEF